MKLKPENKPLNLNEAGLKLIVLLQT